MALTRLYLTYGTDLTSGLIDPRKANRLIGVTPRRPEAEAMLSAASAASDLRAHLDKS